MCYKTIIHRVTHLLFYFFILAFSNSFSFHPETSGKKNKAFHSQLCDWMRTGAVTASATTINHAQESLCPLNFHPTCQHFPLISPEAGSDSRKQAFWFLLLFVRLSFLWQNESSILVWSPWNWCYWDRCFSDKSRAQSHCEFLMLIRKEALSACVHFAIQVGFAHVFLLSCSSNVSCSKLQQTRSLALACEVFSCGKTTSLELWISVSTVCVLLFQSTTCQLTYFNSLILSEFIGVTLVHKTIWVSSVQLNIICTLHGVPIAPRKTFLSKNIVLYFHSKMIFILYSFPAFGRDLSSYFYGKCRCVWGAPTICDVQDGESPGTRNPWVKDTSVEVQRSPVPLPCKTCITLKPLKMILYKETLFLW